MILALVLAATASSSLERVAADVSRVVVAGDFEAPIGVYVEGVPAPVSRAVGSLVMARLAEAKRAPVPVDARDATTAEKLARELRLSTLVRLTVTLEAPKLVVRGDALSTHVNFWSGSTPTRSGPALAIATSVDADLEALTMAGSTPSPQIARPLELSPVVLAKSTHVPAAVTIADVDGDHRGEVIALIGDVVFTWSADGKLRNKTELSAPLSTRPTREPFGFLAVNGGRLTAWSSRRDKPQAFTWVNEGWRANGVVEALVTGPITVTPRPGFSSFQPDFSWAGKQTKWPDALSQLSLSGTLALGVTPGGSASVSRGVSVTNAVTGVGSGSAIADLDGDGTPEVVVTTARTIGESDEVRVLSLGAFESVQTRSGPASEATALWQRKLDGRAVVAAAGDVDGDAVDEVVLGLWRDDGSGELLLLRRTP